MLKKSSCSIDDETEDIRYYFCPIVNKFGKDKINTDLYKKFTSFLLPPWFLKLCHLQQLESEWNALIIVHQSTVQVHSIEHL